MITQGFTFSYSDLAVNDVVFALPSTYLWLPVAGDLVYEAPDGSARTISTIARVALFRTRASGSRTARAKAAS